MIEDSNHYMHDNYVIYFNRYVVNINRTLYSIGKFNFKFAVGEMNSFNDYITIIYSNDEFSRRTGDLLPNLHSNFYSTSISYKKINVSFNFPTGKY